MFFRIMFWMCGSISLEVFCEITPSLDTAAVLKLVSNLNSVASSEITPSLNTAAVLKLVSNLNSVASSEITPSLDTASDMKLISNWNSVASSEITPSLDTAAVLKLVSTLNSVSSCEISPSLYSAAIFKLAPTLSSVDYFDGPSSVSHALTAPTTNSQPTLTQMKYYNNYANAMYCQYQLNDLSCTICQKFRSDVYNHTVIMNNDTSTTALVAVSKTRQEIVVAFRGTMNIWNVILDFATIAVTYSNTPPGVKLHAGFHAATMSLYANIVETVGNIRRRFPYKIVITGHSLGGAMARLTQFYLIALNQFPGAKYECYTYGEPRSGNQAFANFMNAQAIKTARVVNKADIVSHVAPTSFLGSYFVHCQPEYWYVDENNQRFCNTTVNEDPTCSDSLGPAYLITDHAMSLGVNYVPCLFGQPAPWAAIPLGIFQPVGTVSPLPEFMSNFSAGACNSVINALGSVGF